LVFSSFSFYLFSGGPFVARPFDRCCPRWGLGVRRSRPIFRIPGKVRTLSIFRSVMKGNGAFVLLRNAVRSDPARCDFVGHNTIGAFFACGDDACSGGVCVVGCGFPFRTRRSSTRVTMMQREKEGALFHTRGKGQLDKVCMPPEKKALYDEIIRVDQVPQFN